jgi:hypothetical protein
LKIPETGISPSEIEELFVRAALKEPSAIENDDLISADNGR